MVVITVLVHLLALFTPVVATLALIRVCGRFLDERIGKNSAAVLLTMLMLGALVGGFVLLGLSWHRPGQVRSLRIIGDSLIVEEYIGGKGSPRHWIVVDPQSGEVTKRVDNGKALCGALGDELVFHRGSSDIDDAAALERVARGESIEVAQIHRVRCNDGFLTVVLKDGHERAISLVPGRSNQLRDYFTTGNTRGGIVMNGQIVGDYLQPRLLATIPGVAIVLHKTTIDIEDQFIVSALREDGTEQWRLTPSAFASEDAVGSSAIFVSNGEAVVIARGKPNEHFLSDAHHILLRVSAGGRVLWRRVL